MKNRYTINMEYNFTENYCIITKKSNSTTTNYYNGALYQ